MKKILGIIVFVFLLLPVALLAAPFHGESELFLGSGLTDNIKLIPSDITSGVKGKDVFAPGKDIIYWAAISRKKDALIKYIQSIEWYSPDGKMWYKENRDAFSSPSLYFGGSKAKILQFTLKTKTIPPDKEGVWAVKLIWNNSIMNTSYFVYGDESVSPTLSQIADLKNKMQQYDRSISISNKGNYYKFSSHFSRGSKKLLETQEIFRPDIVFGIEEQIFYTLNYDSKEFGLYSSIPRSDIYLFSPDGKLREILDHEWLYDSRDPDYICAFRRKIDLKKLINKNEGLTGLWKLIVFVPTMT